MMEVLNKGKNLKEESRKRCTCNRCGCEFIYDSSDVHPDQRDGEYVICPNDTCKAWINIVSTMERQRRY